MRLQDAPTTEVHVDIAAPPGVVWPFVVDINVPAAFSTEFQGAEWIDPPPRLGVRFLGRNENPRIGRWETTSTVVEFEELGMEAVWRIEVEDFPAFIVVDDKGNDFFAAFR